MSLNPIELSIEASLLSHFSSIGRILAASAEPAVEYRASVYAMTAKHKVRLQWYHQRGINWKIPTKPRAACVVCDRKVSHGEKEAIP